VLPGQVTIEGRRAVIQTCEASAAEMAQLDSADFTRFIVLAEDRMAAVDAICRYVSADGRSRWCPRRTSTSSTPMAA
jgi:hypothetical protein